jgi:hypothetical protein
MTETDLSTWLSIADAAARIGCSTRTVERLAAAKKLESRLRRQDGTPPVAVYNPEDVDRMAAARRPTPPPFVLDAVPAGNGNGHGAAALSRVSDAGIKIIPGDDLIRGLALLLSKAIQSPPSPPVSEKLAESAWIDVPTAAAILGRSQAYVRRQIKDGRLHAERDACLVVRRKDLEEL